MPRSKIRAFNTIVNNLECLDWKYEISDYKLQYENCPPEIIAKMYNLKKEIMTIYDEMEKIDSELINPYKDYKKFKGISLPQASHEDPDPLNLLQFDKVITSIMELKNSDDEFFSSNNSRYIFALSGEWHGGYQYDGFYTTEKIHRFVHNDYRDKPIDITEPILAEMIYKGLFYSEK